MSSPSAKPLKVFLCHASQDKPVVRELSQRLFAEGWIDPWLDEKKLLPGQDWRSKIEEAVETSDIVIICLSSNSVNKEGFVQTELRYAKEIALEKLEESIFLIPLRLDNCVVPRGLRSFHWVNYFDTEKGPAYSDLLAALQLRYEQKLKIEEERARREKEKQEREVAERAEREKAEREAAGKLARVRAAREAAENAALEKAKYEAAEKAEREQAEKAAQEKLAFKVAEKATKETPERETARKVVGEKARLNDYEKAEREKVENPALIKESQGEKSYEQFDVVQDFMSLPKPYLIIAILLLLGGILSLLDVQGIISNAGGIFWGLIFVTISGIYLYVLFRSPKNWLAAFIAFPFLGLAVSTFLPQSLVAYNGLVFFIGISLTFWWVYFATTERWWAIVFGGAFLTLGAVSVLDNISGLETGGSFFLGLGLTFVLVAILPGGSSRTWAWIPGIILLLLGALLGSPTLGFAIYFWSAVLIVLGIYLVFRFMRNQSSG